MKNLIATLTLIVLSCTIALGQEENSSLDNPLGHRVKRNGQDYLIYANKEFEPNFKDYRKINYQVYFRKINHPVKEIGGKKYQLISIPGSSLPKSQTELGITGEMSEYPRAGKSVDKEDYDSNFWIESDIIEKQTDTEYYKFANDVFSGLLTAPFKYRLALGSAPEALIDGDFNIAPFIGWKWRVSSARPFYLAPFGFAGITTLGYNSANNTEIEDKDKLENGTGLTYGMGLSFRFGSVSPGFIVGWDKALGGLGRGFKYSDKAWISFSVNYDFFKASKTAEGAQK